MKSLYINIFFLLCTSINCISNNKLVTIILDQNSTTIKFYRDADEDGYGDFNNFVEINNVPSVVPPEGYVYNNLDIDDQDANLKNKEPLYSLAYPSPTHTVRTSVYYEDLDGDGVGAGTGFQNADGNLPIPSHFTVNYGDADDNNRNIGKVYVYIDADGDDYGDKYGTLALETKKLLVPLGLTCILAPKLKDPAPWSGSLYERSSSNDCSRRGGWLPFPIPLTPNLSVENKLHGHTIPEGFVDNNLDCDDSNIDVYRTCLELSYDENFVYTKIYKNPITDSDIANEEDYTSSVNYFDGLGRKKQQIEIKASPNHKDIITQFTYDEIGRQNKEYLPYPNIYTYPPGALDGLSETHLNQFYSSNYSNELDSSSSNPYSEKDFEDSPLNRVLEQSFPGKDWAIDKTSDIDHTLKFEYGVNLKEDYVRVFSITFVNDETDTPELVLSTTNNGYYLDGKLHKNVVKDENWKSSDDKDHTTEEFKNQRGQVILKRTFNNQNPYNTYYVYDNFDNLTYVLPPKSEAQTVLPNTLVLDNLCYQYKYDSRNRLVEKKIPGKDWEYIIYDNLDRPVLTQDALLREDDQWLFTKYDAFSRVTYTGIYTHTGTEDQGQMQNTLNTFYANNTSANLFEEKQATEGSSHWYSNQSFPKTNLEILTVNYFDTYVFTIHASLSLPTTVWETNDVATNVKTLATGSKVKVLDANDWITTITAYDEKARPIWVGSHNEYLETTDIVKSKLDFVGNVETTVSIHKKTGNEDIVVEDTFTYDHMNRLISQSQEIRATEFDTTNEIELDGTTTNNAILYIAQNSITLKPGFTGLPGFEAKVSTTNTANEKELIVLNTYDELGQLESKKVGGEAENLISNSTGLQTIDYTYNIRGWLKSINDIDNLGANLFSFKLNYNSTQITGTTPLYNGNISESIWKTANDIRGSNLNFMRAYKYEYDALNRIISGINYTRSSNGLFSNYNKNHLQSVSYDLNGNIISLQRKENIYGYNLMRNYSYTYATTSNKLIELNVEGEERYYSYDLNGNLASDNRDFTNSNLNIGEHEKYITYNYLNLPKHIDIAHYKENVFIQGANPEENEGYIKYFYDASGVKLRKEVSDQVEGSLTITDYVGNYVYENNVLQFFNHSEGYVKNDNGTFNYVYQYKDHLGNVRLSYTDNTNSYENIIDSDFSSSFDGWVENGSTSPSLDNGRIKANVNASWEGIRHNLTDLVTNTGETYTLKIKFDKGNTQSSVRVYFTEYDANGNHLRWTTLNGNLQTGEHEYSYVVGSNTKKITLNVDKDNTNTSIETQFYVDYITFTKGSLDIVEESNYYPFGLKHKGYNNVVSSNGNSTAQKWGYQGQELHDELELNVNEFKYRFYDPAIGRFWSIDPLAEDFAYNSTYAFAENKLGLGMELEGRELLGNQVLFEAIRMGYEGLQSIKNKVTSGANKVREAHNEQMRQKVGIPNPSFDFETNRIKMASGLGQMASGINDASHLGLEVAGIVDPTFIADGLNAAWYASEGNYAQASLSSIAMFPYVGDAIGKGGKGLLILGKAHKISKYANKTEGASHMFKEGFGLGLSGLSGSNTIMQAMYKTVDGGGKLLFDLGDVSLDAARGGFKSYEAAAEAGKITEWELSKVLRDKDLFNNAVFHINGTQKSAKDLGLKLVE